MKFKYLKFALPEPSPIFGPTLPKPVIPIELTFKDKRVRYGALVDSGADFCMVDGTIGEFLGIDVRAGVHEVFGGVEESKGLEVFFHTLTLGVGGLEYETAIGFSYDIANHGFCVLGQYGFFDRFIVKFDLVKGEIELKQRRK